MRSLTLPSGAAPVRLDVFLASHVPSCSRRNAQRAIAAGEVRVNGRRARKGDVVGEGDVVEIADALYAPPLLQPNSALVVPILYEDAALIAVDKPAGMPSHALRADETNTVGNFLLARYPELASIGRNRLEPGIVHRLDTDTSGILLAARTADAYVALRQQFAAHRVTKDYLALVEGDVAVPGMLDTPIAHDRRHRGMMRVAADSRHVAQGRQAITHYRPIEFLGGRTLLAVRILTGVMHQIRVHLASIGHPIAGDRLYGGAAFNAAPPRQLLHACGVHVAHPHTGKSVRISSALPSDFTDFLEDLRKMQRASRS